MSERHGLDQAMLRAYSEARCLDYGCHAMDVRLLRDRVERGEPWAQVAVELAEPHLAFAQAEVQDPAQASDALARAAACLRVAQAALEDRPAERLAIYERMVELFDRSMVLSPWHCRRMVIPWKGIAHAAWAYPRSDSRRWVVIWGGADGWCEAYHRSVGLLQMHGLSVCLLELPGQGLARLRGGSRLERDFGAMVSLTLDALETAFPGIRQYAIVGHSLGGSLALRAAADDARITACVTNGGSVEPQRGFAAYPRVLRRFSRMLGKDVSDAQALAFLDDLALPEAAQRMPAALLCLHGRRDELVRDDEASRLVGLHPRATLHSWDDGTHCVYNHADERNRILATWLSTTLAEP